MCNLSGGKPMKIAVGMSGGVDSSVTAVLLKEQGHDVFGATMKLWDNDNRAPECGSCYSKSQDEVIEECKKIAKFIGIRHYVIDLSKEFNQYVIDYFIDSYKKGLTPNPCIYCNEYIKFSKFFNGIEKYENNFDKFATGHYANIVYSDEHKRYLLKSGKNKIKDQSYFLYRLNQNALSKIMFPLYDKEKSEVRDIARKYNLPISEKPDSQDFFAGEYKRLFDDDKISGNIIDKNGNILGVHNGVFNYTIGQRKGLDIAYSHALYVLSIDAKNNTVIVGDKSDMFSTECYIENLNLISIEKIDKPFKALVKTRSTHKGSMATIDALENDMVYIKFDEPTMIVSGGQSAVFYDDDIVIGGGIIV